MKIHESTLSGAYVIEPDRIEDERGFFARSWCQKEFAEFGLNPAITQCNISYNHRRGTLRGMHFQKPPYGETKLVRCTTGAVYDVIIDLRPESASYLRWFGIELSAENRVMLYIPDGFAHGFLTRTDSAELFYQMSNDFVPGSGAGVRWNDPAFEIAWPEPPVVISDRDNSYPDFIQVSDRIPQGSTGS